MWTVANKDGFEITLFRDAKLISSFGNFFSGTRAGELARGAHKQVESFQVWIPESPWHFNVEGRSATDSSDQDRKKMALAERRITRQGHKGIVFVFDIAFDNAYAMWSEMAPEDISTSKWIQNYTKVGAHTRLQPASHLPCTILAPQADRDHRPHPGELLSQVGPRDR